jgi:nucleotide-binding universal stress UspA family protein
VGQPVGGGEYLRECELDTRHQLETLLPTDVAAPVETQVRHGKPYAEILAAVAEARADLIVLGIHARGALDLAILGSTTNQIVRRASCPVLTARLT